MFTGSKRARHPQRRTADLPSSACSCARRGEDCATVARRAPPSAASCTLCQSARPHPQQQAGRHFARSERTVSSVHGNVEQYSSSMRRPPVVSAALTGRSRAIKRARELTQATARQWYGRGSSSRRRVARGAAHALVLRHPDEENTAVLLCALLSPPRRCHADGCSPVPVSDRRMAPATSSLMRSECETHLRRGRARARAVASSCSS